LSSKEEQVFFEIHDQNLREGPGDFASTQKAFSCLKDLPPHPQILDIGCGPGQQTLDLAKITDGRIIAVDKYDQFIGALKKKIEGTPLKSQITPTLGDMEDLKFNKNTFDVVWAEGSIYIMGFQKGLESWRKFLKPGGYIAVTEATWLKKDLPPDLKKYWDHAYPAITDIDTNIQTVKNAGYHLVGHFTLPESAWWDNYYASIQNKIPALKKKYAGDAVALGVIQAELDEMELYRKYASHFGYVFYIAQKPNVT
jgi:ubiquinone/menaquinone biosynthesis C-methylase UbiE